jgi:hypothetical protein
VHGEEGRRLIGEEADKQLHDVYYRSLKPELLPFSPNSQ